MESRHRVAVCVGLMAAVALVVTIVQQSESGLVHELEGEIDMGFDAYPKFAPEDSFDEEEFSLIEIDESKTADPRLVIGHLIDLRAYCKLVREDAKELLDKSYSNTALPSFIVAFGSEPPAPPKPAPHIKDGIQLPGKWSPPPFNVVTWYAKAMGEARKKFAKSGGINSYVLDNLDASLINGHRAVLYTQNEHKKNPYRVQISPAAMGVTEAPTYVKTLDTARVPWAKVVHHDEKEAESADVVRAASFLKVGAKSTYKSFMQEAMMREHAKYRKFHDLEVKSALEAIKHRYKTKSGADSFKNIQMLPSAGKRGASSIPLPTYKTRKEIQQDAEAAAAKFVKGEANRKSNIKKEIDIKEHSAERK